MMNSNDLFKGIILAGGSGSRLFPSTFAISKQLIPIYDKPMIYYSLSTLMMAKIRDILIISTPDHMPIYKKLLGNGSNLGIKISYKVQEKPEGIAQAFIIGEEFISNKNVALILGDNLFYGDNFQEKLIKATSFNSGGTIFSCVVDNPQDFGVVELDNDDRILSIEEKPSLPKSNQVITGLYFYDNNVIKISKGLKPSRRGELEITDINLTYLKKDLLRLNNLGEGFVWLDTGTPNALLEASNFIMAVEKRHGFKVGCIEEIAFKNNWITREQFAKIIDIYPSNNYGLHLKNVLNKI
tara:strand:+ start:23166 stop:24056 length:891 start_codon:yes stop_codon:yes gene_type:complete